MKRSENTLYGYLVALFATAIAITLRWLFDPWLGAALTLVTLPAAAAITVWFGGYRPAILGAVAGYIACDYLFIGPRLSFGFDTPHLIGLLIYVITCSVIIALGEAMRIARRRAEETERLQNVTFASIGDAVITSDNHGRVVDLNLAAEALTGWRKDDAEGKPLETIFHKVDAQTRQATQNPREGSGTGGTDHAVLVARDGTQRLIADNTAPIEDEHGQILGNVLVFRDVTESGRLQDALLRSEHELSDFFENATVALHWVGPDGTILRANQAELDMLGYGREEYVGHHIAEFHADQPVIEDILGQLLSGKTLREYPARLRHKNGSILDVAISSSGLFENGEFIHTRCFTRDITELKRAQETRTLVASIVESSDDAIVSKSLEGIIQSWNASAGRIFGYKAEEAIGRPITLIIPPERIAEEQQIMSRLRAGQRIDHFETVRLRKDGERIDVSLTISPIKDATGRVIGASKIARDISARKRSEEALRRSEERFRELANNIDQFAWTCDKLGHTTWYNRRWYEYTGTTFEEAGGDGWKRFHHPAHLDRVTAGLARSAATGEPWEDIFLLRSKEGTYRWFLSRAVPIRDETGRVVRWLGTNTDITEQRHLEDALREADRRKDEFLATLAHELRNPLAPIRNVVEILKMQTPAAPELQWSRDVLDRQVQHMTRLLDDLLDVSRISHGKLELRKERTNLQSVIQTAIETNRPTIDERGCELTVTLPPEPVPLDADPIRLSQIFSNLLNNALKYTEVGGHIRLTGEQHGNEAIISVRDDGIGIDAATLPRIFDMFSQGKVLQDRSHDGLGIGLSLVRGLVELHGGTIEARSEGPAKGSEFILRLPAAVAAATPTSGPEPKTKPSAAVRSRILVADDNRSNADSLSMLLKVMGHEVHTVYDGRDAIQTAERVKPDAILLDIGMPELNGYEACRRIREQPWGKGLMLVAVTGWGQDDDRRRIWEAGFDHHVVKPVNASDLEALLADNSQQHAAQG